MKPPPRISDWECAHGNLEPCPWCSICPHGLPYLAACWRCIDAYALASWGGELLDEG